MATPYLLDTTVLLHWTRGKKQAQALNEQFQLTDSPLRPLICEVSLGEMAAFAKNPKWSDAQREKYRQVGRHVAAVDISDPRVIEAYADLSTLAHKSNWPIFHGKNDLWIAAAAKASGSHLLSMDKDFLPLRGLADWQVTVLDPHTALPLP